MDKLALIMSSADTLSAVFKAVTELEQYKQEQKTERKRIEAESKSVIERIQATKECFMAFIEHSYSERRDNFNKLFEALENPKNIDNIDLRVEILNSILTIARDNPLSQFKNFEKFKEMIKDKDQEINI